jgi:DNA gyrase inhibitor GyrI
MSFAESTAQIATQPTETLVLEQLPSGEYAWLRPKLDAAIRDADAPDHDMTARLGWPSQVHVHDVRHDRLSADTRFGITEAGRAALVRAEAMENLFGQPWPTVVEACR